MTGIDAATRRRHRRRNIVESGLLLFGMMALLAACAGLVFGWQAAPVAVGLWTLALLLTPRLPVAWVLALYRAQRLPPEIFPTGHRLLTLLASRAELPRRPVLYYVPSMTPNAFSVADRRVIAVAVTDGLLRRLDARELAGVLAHEISHIRNHDLWVMTLADGISRLTRVMAMAGVALMILNVPLWLTEAGGVSWGLVLLLILAPSLAALLQLALSRAREFRADLDAVALTGDPAGLASALRKLDLAQAGVWERILLPGRRSGDPSLLRSHPATEARIERLRSLAGAPSQTLVEDAAEVDLPGHWPRVTHRPRWRLTGLWY